jgi:hypothetical protein
MPPPSPLLLRPLQPSCGTDVRARAREGFSRPCNTRHRSRVLLINSMT